MPQVNRKLGKNATYAVIAVDLLTQGSAPAPDRLWPLVRARDKET